MDNPAKWWGNRRSRGGKFSFWCVGLCWRYLFFWRYLAGCNGSPLFARCLLPSLAGEGRDGGLCGRGRYQHRAKPGVARRLLTFLASPRKVSKRRRPEVHRPAKARGALRYSKRQAAAELGLEWVLCKGFRLCSPSDSPRGLLLSFLRYSATLIGTRSADNHCLKLFVISHCVRNDKIDWMPKSSAGEVFGA